MALTSKLKEAFRRAMTDDSQVDAFEAMLDAIEAKLVNHEARISALE